ncbi:MAG: hypothetical protein R3E96_09920 [Planctomycetota bacterium]
MLDARGGAAYVASYLREEHDLLELRPPMRIRRDESQAIELESGAVFGDETVLDWFERPGTPLTRRGACLPTAGDLLVRGRVHYARNGASQTEAVRPLYLAPFGA